VMSSVPSKLHPTAQQLSHSSALAGSKFNICYAHFGKANLFLLRRYRGSLVFRPKGPGKERVLFCVGSYDHLCGLVVRVPGYRSGGPRFDSQALQKKVVRPERGPLSLVITTEELLGRNSSCFGLESREYGRRDSSR
jgi:hypothetical protein